MGLTSIRVHLCRPYSSEQEIPTLEELVGVSEHHFLVMNCVDGEEARVELGGLLKSLDPPTHAIPMEEENWGRLQVYLESPANLDFVIDHLSPLHCGISGVLLTRAERHRSRMLPISRLELETNYNHAGRQDGGSRTAQLQVPARPKVDNPSEVLLLSFAPKPNLVTFRMTIMGEAPTMSNRTRWIRAP